MENKSITKNRFNEHIMMFTNKVLESCNFRKFVSLQLLFLHIPRNDFTVLLAILVLNNFARCKAF